MRAASSRAVLDACVLANHGLCDLFLRLAERPRLYSPKWSPRILEEVSRTHITKLHWPPDLAERWSHQVQRHFPEALVQNTDCLEPVLINDANDRHVLATAIRSAAATIVTFNLRDFPVESLTPWDIQAVHPSDYLITLHGAGPDVVIAKLAAMAGDRNLSPEAYLSHLARSVPAFAIHVAQAVGWNLTPP